MHEICSVTERDLHQENMAHIATDNTHPIVSLKLVVTATAPSGNMPWPGVLHRTGPHHC